LGKVTALTKAEKRLAAELGFDEDVCKLVKQRIGGPLQQAMAFNDEFELVAANGISVALSREQINSFLAQLRSELQPRGYAAFWSDQFDARGMQKSEEIVVLNDIREDEFVRLQKTNGGNYGVSNDDLIARLEKWRSRFDFEIVGASGSWVALRLKTLPAKICQFAEEVYEFCPDIVDQGVGLANESDEPDVFQAARKLCPKLSTKMEKKLAQKRARFEKMCPPELRAILNTKATPPEMGIRLLAVTMRDSRELFLWWD
jgi:hypothetical protein